MPEFRDHRHLPYSRQQMFDLVSDVEKYHEFLPWCLASRTYNQKTGKFDADLIIGFKMFREKFTSRVTIDEPNKVFVDYISGPLKNLYNHWYFTEVEDGTCVVDFRVDLEFKNKMLERLIGDIFTKATYKMISAFEERARALYA